MLNLFFRILRRFSIVSPVSTRLEHYHEVDIGTALDCYIRLAREAGHPKTGAMEGLGRGIVAPSSGGVLQSLNLLV